MDLIITTIKNILVQNYYFFRGNKKIMWETISLS